MNRFKFDAFVKEFPFLAEIIDGWGIDCDYITIKRATRELMTHTPHYYGATGSLVGINDGERIDFVLEDGTVIRDAVECSGEVIHNEAHTDNEYWPGETIAEAIYKLEKWKALAYIVSYEYGYNVRDHHSLHNFRVTIFKPGRDFTWNDIISSEIAMAQAEVEAEANF